MTTEVAAEEAEEVEVVEAAEEATKMTVQEPWAVASGLLTLTWTCIALVQNSKEMKTTQSTQRQAVPNNQRSTSKSKLILS